MAYSVNLTLTANQAKLVKVALNDYAQKRVDKFCSDKCDAHSISCLSAFSDAIRH